MIAETREAYMSTAIRLARGPDALRGIRERLAANRLTYPLFNNARFARDIESAYGSCGAGTGRVSRRPVFQ